MANRINLNVPDNTRQILNGLNESMGFNITTSVCKGVGLLDYIVNLQREGASFQVHEKNGKVREVEIRLE